MTGDFDALVDRIATEGLAEDETLHSLLDRLRGAVAQAALDHYPTRKGAACALGITREGFYKIRRQHGLPTNGNSPKPIPADYRERLSTAPSPSPCPTPTEERGCP